MKTIHLHWTSDGGVVFCAFFGAWGGSSFNSYLGAIGDVAHDSGFMRWMRQPGLMASVARAVCEAQS